MNTHSALLNIAVRGLSARLLRVIPVCLLCTAPAWREQSGSQSPSYIQSCWVAGAAQSEASAVLGEIKPGDTLELRTQSRRSRATPAIEVFWHGRRIGRLPAAARSSIVLLSHRASIAAQVVETAGIREFPAIRIALTYRGKPSGLPRWTCNEQPLDI